jgi:glycosyltransferase involved in cell wall biosynthesis
MATYNGERYVLEQLRSILSQLSDTDEVIISDDGSSDSTCAIIEQINDSRIRLFRHPEPQGPGKNFEFALSQAKGQFIYLADQDDVWENKKISTMQTYLTAYDLVVSDCSIIDLNGKSLYDSYFMLRCSGAGILKNLRRNSYMGCCMAFRQQILGQVIPLPKNIPMHDWWIGLVAETVGTTFFCPEKLVKYRRHRKNSTPLAGRSRFGFVQQMVFRVNLVVNLINVWIKYRKR